MCTSSPQEGLRVKDKLGVFGDSYDMWMEIDPHLLLFTGRPSGAYARTWKMPPRESARKGPPVRRGAKGKGKGGKAKAGNGNGSTSSRKISFVARDGSTVSGSPVYPPIDLKDLRREATRCEPLAKHTELMARNLFCSRGPSTVMQEI